MAVQPIGDPPIRAPEGVLDPTVPIIDAHHHLKYGPRMTYMFPDLLADIRRGHNIRATVYIENRTMSRSDGPEAFRPVGETEFANGVAAMSASGLFGDCRTCAAIVGFADLALGDRVQEVLEAHVVAGGGRFRGIRQGTYWDESPEAMSFVSMHPPKGLLRNTAFRSGFSRLVRMGLSFDAVLFHPQLPELIDLARAFPDGQIVLNHMGFPLGVGPYAGRRAEVFATWNTDMGELARCSNVVVKTGGLGLPLSGFDFHLRKHAASSEELAAAWAPYIHATVDLFGPSRCMFESNFPTDRASCDYVTIWNALKRIAARYSIGERDALFRSTATRVYRISAV